MMGTKDVMEFTVKIMKSGVKIKQPSGIVISASGKFTVLLFVYPGYLHSVGQGFIADIRL